MELFLLFVLYSFFGCVLENIYYYIHHGQYVSKRTLLNLPLCPVYGFAALTLAAADKGIEHNPFMLFVTGFLAVSAVELAFYLVCERAYGIKWWDYSGMRINLMGGVSLYYSVMWGMLNIVFAILVHPYCGAAVHMLSHTAKMYLSLFVGVYLLADLRQTHSELIKYKNGEKSLVAKKFLYLLNNN
ncbi:MAG: putative ABC transporter permease [Firmicutes bacterium]|nr:putative ABC transporter permease [Bacillota bacterium]